MNYTITTTLNIQYYNFLEKESKAKKITKKSILEKALEYYKKHELEQQVKKWFESRKQEYKNNAKEFWEVQFNSLKD